VHLAETAANVQRPANPQGPVQGSTAPREPQATIRNIESGKQNRRLEPIFRRF